MNVVSTFVFKMNEDNFVRFGCEALRYQINSRLHYNKVNKTFYANYGVEAYQAAILWNMIVQTLIVDDKFHPIHLLWTLYFLKQYSSKLVMSYIFDAHKDIIAK